MVPNVKLLRETLAHIEANPETWDQRDWRRDLSVANPERCGTSFCFAGWAAELSGAKWKYPANHMSSKLIVLPGGGQLVVENFAVDLLGIEDTRDETGEIPLFDSGNDLDDLRRIVAEICAEADAA